MPTKKNQRFEVERAVRADRTLPSNTKFVILMLATYADARGSAHPGQHTLAANCGWNQRTVRKALAPARGKYVTVHQGGDGRPATYCLTLIGEKCGHDRLREDLEANSPAPQGRPEEGSARPSGVSARPSEVSARPSGASARPHRAEISLLSTKDKGRSLVEQEELSFSPEIRTSELASAAIRLDLRNMPPVVLDVIEAIALDLLGGERNGLVDWSFDGVTYRGLRSEIDEMSSPEVLREVLNAIDMVRVGRESDERDRHVRADPRQMPQVRRRTVGPGAPGRGVAGGVHPVPVFD
jgi:hypothetical protein